MPSNCSVASCRNNHKGMKKNADLMFHAFPTKNEAVTKEWVKFCKKTVQITTKFARICSDHFEESAYVRDLKNELLGLPTRRVLKPDAVPTLAGGEEDCSVTPTHREKKGKITKTNSGGANLKEDDFKTRLSQNRPSRCLFCYSPVPSKKGDTGSANQINVMFILRKVLAVPKDKVDEFRRTEGNPEEWIGLCDDCEATVKVIKQIHDELMESKQKFREAQQTLLQTVKESLAGSETERTSNRRVVDRLKVTDECRQYVARAPSFNIVPRAEPHLPSHLDPEPGTNGQPNPQVSSCQQQSDETVLPETEAAEIVFIHSTQAEAISFRPNPNSFRLYSTNSTDLDSQPPSPASNSTSDPPPRRKSSSTCRVTTAPNPNDVPERPKSRPKKSQKLLCPVCSRFKCIFENSIRFCTHLATCPGIQPEDMESETKVARLKCSECKDFECGLAERVLYVDHALHCHSPMAASPIPLSLRVFECSICTHPQQRFMSFAKFLQHYKFHLSKQYRCFKCDFKCSKTRLLLMHWKKKHAGSGSSEKDPSSSEEPEYVRETLPKVPWWCPCPECQIRFDSEEDRDSHILSEGHSPSTGEQERGHTCKIGSCEKSYFSEDELLLHQKTRHVASAVEEPPLESVQDVFKCDQDDCAETFTSESNYEGHRRRVHRLDLLQCEYCGKEFLLQRALKCHITQMHKTEKKKKDPLSCDQCPKQFKSRGNLNAHIRHVHKKKFKLQCHICSKGIPSRPMMQVHLARAHRAAPPRFPCTVEGCDKFFHARSRLAEHTSWHLGQPEYKCTLCGKSYYSNAKLKRHMQLHANKDTKPFQCELCPKRFASGHYLYLHRRQTHYKNMPRKRRVKPT